jgi:hypothetical protein
MLKISFTYLFVIVLLGYLTRLIKLEEVVAMKSKQAEEMNKMNDIIRTLKVCSMLPNFFAD